jgi:hypothetical protein
MPYFPPHRHPSAHRQANFHVSSEGGESAPNAYSRRRFRILLLCSLASSLLAIQILYRCPKEKNEFLIALNMMRNIVKREVGMAQNQLYRQC